MYKKEMKAAIVLGTRPEAIKLAPVVYGLREKKSICLKICSTGQHREMLDQALQLFQLRPDYELDVMRHDQSLAAVTATMLRGLDETLRNERPDMVVVQGDTTSAMVGALSAYYHRIPVAHVEAGLRTYQVYNPFPEEVNRVLVDAVSQWCFAPTARAFENLLRAGTGSEKVFLTGNTVVDALNFMRERIRGSREREMERELRARLGIELNGSRTLLVTGHRRETFGEEFESLCLGLKRVVAENPDTQIIYPVHLNPNVRRPVETILGQVERIHLVPPVDYEFFVFLLSRCFFVLTDSGGIQEEAPVFGKPVLVMRKTTERPEGIEAGIAKLVGTCADSIAAAANELLHRPAAYDRMARCVNPYGDGRAGKRIANILAASNSDCRSSHHRVRAQEERDGSSCSLHI